MRLQLLLPKVEPKEISEPRECVYEGCGSKQVQMHQPVEKALRDTVYQQVQVHRYRCGKCGRTFRVYPKGVSQGQTSDRVKGIAVMLYLLGISYGGVSLALESLGVPLSKTAQPVEKPLAEFMDCLSLQPLASLTRYSSKKCDKECL
jgi:hypothetical protein